MEDKGHLKKVVKKNSEREDFGDFVRGQDWIQEEQGEGDGKFLNWQL